MGVVTPLNNPGGPEGDTVTVAEKLLNTEYCNAAAGPGRRFQHAYMYALYVYLISNPHPHPTPSPLAPASFFVAGGGGGGVCMWWEGPCTRM